LTLHSQGSWVQPRNPEIQVIGPDVGRCSAVVVGTANFLDDEQFSNVFPTSLTASSDLNSEIESTDGTVFVFPAPERAPDTACHKALAPVAEATAHHALQNTTDGEHTILAFEAAAVDHVSDAYEQVNTARSCLPKATKREGDELDQLKEKVFSACLSIKK
jgi:hypothetical protein